MKRAEAIKIIQDYLRKEDTALFTTGMISREAFANADRKANFYMIGSMGLASSLGLGVALNTRKRVFVFDGDGSALMDMGTMALIGSQRPSNLIHIVLDNESYDSTGGQPTISNIIRLDKIANDCGYAYSQSAQTANELKAVLKNLCNKKGPGFILVKVLDKNTRIAERVQLPPRKIKKRFMDFLKKDLKF